MTASPIRAASTLMMAAVVAACEGPQPPEACGPMPQVTVNAKESTTVTACFDDPNGDMLSYSATSSNPGVSTVSASGSKITITAVLPGSSSIKVTAADPGGLTAQQTFQVTVPNRAPVAVGTIADVEVPVDTTAALDVAASFSEPDGEGLVYGAASSNGKMATVSVSGSVVSVRGVSKGTVTVTVTAADPGGLTAQQTFEVTVPNRAPVAVGTIADIEVQVDATADVDVAGSFSDPDGDALTYSATSSSPANATVSVSGSAVSVRGVSKGTATVTVTAEDTEGLTAQQSFEVTVPNRAPVAVGTIADVEVQVDTTATVDVAGSFSDPDGDPLTYSAMSSSPANATVSVSGSAVVVRGVSKGRATVTVTAQDTEGLTAQQNFQVTVPNRAPVAVGTIADIEVQVNATADVDVAGSFSDPDGDSLTYSATSSNPSNATVSVSGSAVVVRGVSKGAATVTVTAEDTEGLTAQQTFQVTVPNRAPVAVGTIADIEVQVDATADVDMAGSFSDPDGDALTYSATSSSPANATVSVSGSAVAVKGVSKGTATVTVTAEDTEGLTAQQSFEVTVPNRAPVAVGTIADIEVQVDTTASVDVAGSFSDPDGDALTYSATSSSPANATVSVSGSAVAVKGVSKGTTTVTVTAEDTEGLTAQQSFEVTVPNRAPVAVGTIADVEVQVDTTATVDVAGSFSDPDGDALTYSATSSSPANATVSVSGSAVVVKGVSKGRAIVTVTARDTEGLTAEQSFEVTVPNRAPVAVGTIADIEVEVNTTATVGVAGSFSDPDGDPLTYSATSSSPANATVSVSGSAVAVRGVSRGTATVTVTARDPEGLTAQQSFRVTVSENQAPVAVGTIADIEVEMDTTADVNVAENFSDPDGDPLTYSATSSSPANATVSVSGSAVVVRGVSEGTATVTATARDPGGLTAQQSFGVTVSNPDRLVLEEFYDSMDGDNWTTSTNWKTDAPLNEWHGVTTNQTGRVVGLELVGDGLAGEIPAVVGRLRYLQAQFNIGLSGGITGGIPPELGNLSNLKRLNLVGTSLDGAIPPELGNMSNLEELVLSYNSLTGAIPSELGNLSNLRELSLGSNSLTGPIPPELGNMSNLRGLYLFRNSLDGQIPSGLGNLSKLEELELASNSLTGPIPPELGNLSNLRELELEDNSLEGAIPPELGNLSSLRKLLLVGNSLGGPIPPELGHLSKLEGLVLNGVSLTGRIPPELGNMSSLKELELASNSLTGPIPPELGKLSNLEVLTLSDNSLTGSIPRELAELGELEDLRLDRNELSGAIPGELGDLSRLRYLELHLNELSGAIPPELGDLANLETLWLHANELTGPLPSELGSLGDLDRLRVHANQLEGEVPSTFLDLGDLRLFWFHENDEDDNLCAPDTSTFTRWLNAMDDWVGDRCRDREVFDLEMRFTSSVSGTVRSHLEEARQEWADILIDTELEDIDLNRTVHCGGVTRYVGTVDDHMVWVHVYSIDGEGGILAYAGYCIARTEDDSPVLSRVIFDADDIDGMLDHDVLAPIAVHELAHGLGFSGYHWDKYGLLEKGSDAHFTGELAIEAFDEAGGEDYEGNKVPIQLGGYSHWRESVFRDEVMSPGVDMGDDDLPVSAITLQSMAAIGYEVDLSLADDYELPDPSIPPPPMRREKDPTVFDLGNDVVWGPVAVVDADGRVVRVIPPPPGATPWPVPRRDVDVEPPQPPAPGSAASPTRSRPRSN